MKRLWLQFYFKYLRRSERPHGDVVTRMRLIRSVLFIALKREQANVAVVLDFKNRYKHLEIHEFYYEDLPVDKMGKGYALKAETIDALNHLKADLLVNLSDNREITWEYAISKLDIDIKIALYESHNIVYDLVLKDSSNGELNTFFMGVMKRLLPA
jgi:hypothetical protein